MGKNKPTKTNVASVKKENPFEKRGNQTQKHPALNRKLKGANRNVGQARLRANEKRENTLLKEFKSRKSASQIVDRRFGETDDSLTREEKMLKRFQTVRSKKRVGRFQLGDEDLPPDEDLTHMGKSLNNILDEENIEEEDEEEEDENETIEQLVKRLKRGEDFHQVTGSSTKTLSKKERMIDGIKKAKILKMERQKEKEEDSEERERVDALLKDVVSSGNLDFRTRQTEPSTGADEYERMVRELQVNPGPKAAATERTKTAEEIARDEIRELERLETERLKRMEGDLSEEEDEEDDQDDEDERRSRKKGNSSSSKLEIDADDTSIPFVIECPASYLEFLEFLNAHPNANLEVIIQRIRRSTSVHLKAENRQKLTKFCEILLEHLYLLAERSSQLNITEEENLSISMSVIVSQLYGIVTTTASKEVGGMYYSQLENIRRTLETNIIKSNLVDGKGGDYGILTCEFGRPSFEKKLPGGHKDGLADTLNTQANRLSELRQDSELASSSTRCWPSGSTFAFYVSILPLFSTTDSRHPVVSSATLLLGRTLSECPIRGPRDVVAALQTAQLLEQMTRNDAGRFAPEVFCFLRVFLSQISKPGSANSDAKGECLFRLDSALAPSHPAFDVFRGNKKSKKDGEGAESFNFKGFFSYKKKTIESNNPILRNTTLKTISSLLENCAKSVRNIPSAEVLLQPLIQTLEALNLDCFKTSLALLKMIMIQTKQGRVPLRLQDFAPEDRSLTPKFLEDSLTSKRPGEADRVLKKKFKRERKGVGRELRLDAAFLSNARNKEKNAKLKEARNTRQRNFASLEHQQSEFNRLVKSGIAVKGAGVGGLNFKGRRQGKKVLE